MGERSRPPLEGCRVQLGDGARGRSFLRLWSLGDLVRRLLGLVRDRDLFLLAGVLGPCTSVLTLLEIDLVADLEGDLEYDEFVPSVGGGVGGPRLGSQLGSRLGSRACLLSISEQEQLVGPISYKPACCISP